MTRRGKRGNGAGDSWLAKNGMDLAAIAISIVSLTTSALSVWMNVRLQHDVSAAQAIQSSYATFYDLDKMALEHKFVSHLFSGPGYYARVKAQIAAALATATPAEKAGYLLEERQAASLVFDYFEETVLQQQQARKSGDDEKLRYLETNLRYFDENALRNPRLLWYWSVKGGDLSSDYDKATVDYFRAHVANDASITKLGDPTSPFEASR